MPGPAGHNKMLPYYLAKKRDIWILDESLNFNSFGGNKIRKILATLRGHNYKGLLTHGSPYSNHILATSFVAKIKGWPSTLIIIADKDIAVKAYPNLNLAESLGSKIIFTNLKDATIKIEMIKKKLSNYFWLPGGCHTCEGFREYSLLFKNIFKETPGLKKIDWILLPYGTGTTALGALDAVKKLKLKIKVLAVSVSRNKTECIQAAKEFMDINNEKMISVIDDYAGEYGVIEPHHSDLRLRFLKDADIFVDPVYNIRTIEYYYKNQLKNGLIVNTGGNYNSLITWPGQ